MSEPVATILIVDDLSANIRILGDALTGEYRLLVAMNGADALMLAEQHRPDLILMDIVMPGMDGFELLQRLRGIEPLADIPVIFVTALEDVTDESYGLRLGAADYITKPFNPDIVRLRVKNHLELKRQRDLVVRRNEELEEALSRVKSLEGIIPICAYCKKIRNDNNSWQQLESYFAEHSDALFSHGICPACYDKEWDSVGRDVKSSDA